MGGGGGEGGLYSSPILKGCAIHPKQVESSKDGFDWTNQK